MFGGWPTDRSSGGPWLQSAAVYSPLPAPRVWRSRLLTPNGFSIFFRWQHHVAAVLLLLAASARADTYADIQALVRDGRPAQALERAEQALAEQPRDPQLRFLRGVILSQAGRTDEALAVFTGLTQEYPELPEPHNNLAVIHAQRGELDKARSALEEALRANPGYAVAHENLGDIHVRLAGRSYRRAAQLEAGNAALPRKLSLVAELLEPKRAAESAGR
ncbi:tetratricopeptide repeat protein [Ramlibacter sp. AW1]|uniref:Tetratricopeptide repeat protein n=1 Tax=Ramlibacter aurantiacus TaxID=2801330 RepID=A0A936ZNE4_9BURK|nr:tetratricopeptide repeat protein [Ramlibacter aurantiacus]